MPFSNTVFRHPMEFLPRCHVSGRSQEFRKAPMTPPHPWPQVCIWYVQSWNGADIETLAGPVSAGRAHFLVSRPPLNALTVLLPIPAYSWGRSSKCSSDYSENQYSSHIDAAREDFSQGLMPGKFLDCPLPFLRHIPSWIPGAGFQNTFARVARSECGPQA